MKEDSLETLNLKLKQFFNEKGFEIYPFKVGWYNEVTDSVFHLPYSFDTLAFLVLSTPDMFELNFLPHLRQSGCVGQLDPLDDSVARFTSLAVESLLSDLEVEVFHDFDIDPVKRRPRVLVQSAGHVSGAAFYYQRHHINDHNWNNEKKLAGVSIHPAYGGWFAFRGVIILKTVQVPALVKTEPPDVVPTEEGRKELLDLFNFHWQDSRYRDIILPKKRYGDIQLEYFNAPPKNRTEVIEMLLSL